MDSLLIVATVVGFCNCSMFRCALLCVNSIFAIILMGNRELIALVCLSFWCLVIGVSSLGWYAVCDCFIT